jgi:hypothetical protein
MQVLASASVLLAASLNLVKAQTAIFYSDQECNTDEPTVTVSAACGTCVTATVPTGGYGPYSVWTSDLGSSVGMDIYADTACTTYLGLVNEADSCLTVPSGTSGQQIQSFEFLCGS